jgi:tRNA dimethylallyltransferase
MSETSRPKLVAVVGTNASGKSALGVALAKIFDGEIVSADSRQVYRGLDIGTGKLDAQEMRGVVHHLIDVLDPTERRFSLAEYQRLAYDVIDDVRRRGRLPILVGGTGLYVRAVVEGYNLAEAPPDLGRRAQLETLPAADLWQLLASYDKSASEKIDPRNARRIIRAIEIIERGVEYPHTFANEPRYRTLQLGLTWPPDLLRARIDARLRNRLEVGMVEEAENLMARGLTAELMDSLGLEYRHLAKLVTGEYQDTEELFEKLRTAIYRFSRRQMSWFRKDESIIWLDAQRNYVDEAATLIEEFLQGASKG